MKICIIGGGNMGSLLASRFSQKVDVTLFLNAPYEHVDEYSEKLQVLDEEGHIVSTGKISKITDKLEEAVTGAEWIFVTFPSFLFEGLAKEMIPLLTEGQHLVGIPGSGGFEMYFKDAVSRGCTITGLQRVHSVARIIEKGKQVKQSGVRDELKVASIPSDFNPVACDVISTLYDMPVEPLRNYLNITLINSNPILHTSRLYSIFRDFDGEHGYDSLPLFYENWSLETSKLLSNMDKELFEIIRLLCDNGADIHQITPILEHYESTDAESMTNKIRSINSLKGLTTPSVIGVDGKYFPDFNSRYFTADFGYGLDILVAFARAVNAHTPNLCLVSDWYQKIMNKQSCFDMSTFALDSIDKIIAFYH